MESTFISKFNKVPLAPAFVRKNRPGQVAADSDLFGTSLQVAGAGISAAGRPRLPIRLMASLLYLKHAFNLSDKELVVRWSENVVWVRRETGKV
jgi:IS5 family transposase